jgi:hypothetical protein
VSEWENPNTTIKKKHLLQNTHAEAINIDETIVEEALTISKTIPLKRRGRLP